MLILSLSFATSALAIFWRSVHSSSAEHDSKSSLSIGVPQVIGQQNEIFPMVITIASIQTGRTLLTICTKATKRRRGLSPYPFSVAVSALTNRLGDGGQESDTEQDKQERHRCRDEKTF
jgi:hypothetical protein